MGVIMELTLEQELEIHLILLTGAEKNHAAIIPTCILAIDYFHDGSDDLILLPEALRSPNSTPAVAAEAIIDAFQLHYWLPEWARG